MSRLASLYSTFFSCIDINPEVLKYDVIYVFVYVPQLSIESDKVE